MKTAMQLVAVLALCGAAFGQTNNTREASDYLVTRLRESQMNYRSNLAARPRGFGEQPKYERLNNDNPGAAMLEDLNRRGVLTNENIKVLIDNNGGAWVMPKQITREKYERLLRVRPYLATNYTAADIITNPPPREQIDWRKMKMMPAEIQTPEQKDKWRRENFPEWYTNDPTERPVKGSGGGDVWNDPRVGYYQAVLRPMRAPVKPRWPIIRPDPNPPSGPPLFDPPIFGGSPVIFDWSNQPPSEITWSDGVGAGNEAMMGNTAFFAPLISTSPCRGTPPLMRKLSMKNQVGFNRLNPGLSAQRIPQDSAAGRRVLE